MVLRGFERRVGFSSLFTAFIFGIGFRRMMKGMLVLSGVGGFEFFGTMELETNLCVQ